MGEIDESRTGALESALDDSARGQGSFPMKVEGAGAFPNWKRPRVFWAGVRDPSEALGKLAARVEGSTVRAGFAPQDKPFSAHLTLARFSSPLSSGLEEKLKSTAGRSFGSFTADRMALVRSRLGPSGSIYEDIKEFSFHVG